MLRVGDKVRKDKDDMAMETWVGTSSHAHACMRKNSRVRAVYTR